MRKHSKVSVMAPPQSASMLCLKKIVRVKILLFHAPPIKISGYANGEHTLLQCPYRCGGIFWWGDFCKIGVVRIQMMGDTAETINCHAL